LFSESAGQGLYNAIKSGDWGQFVESIVSPIVSNMLGGLTGGLGPLGGLFGGFIGAAIGDLFGGGGIFGSKKADPLTSTYRVEIQNWPDSLEAGIDLMPVNAMRGGSVNINLVAGNAGARDIARALSTEMALT
jgi:hypothetical protein